MIRKNADGTLTTTTDVVEHVGYPCPPSRDPDVSCRQALERYAERTGKTIIEKEPDA